jgi:hypothetical protein
MARKKPASDAIGLPPVQGRASGIEGEAELLALNVAAMAPRSQMARVDGGGISSDRLGFGIIIYRRRERLA